MQDGKNKPTVREFTRSFKNEHNVDGVGYLFDIDLSLSGAHRSFPWA